MRWALLTLCFVGSGSMTICSADDRLPMVEAVESQPLVAQVRRLVQALEMLGKPLSDADRTALETAFAESDSAKSTAAIQTILDPHCLVGVDLPSKSNITARRGPAAAELDEQGWSQFLVKVHNPSKLKGVVRAASPNARRLAGSPADDVDNRWLGLQMFDRQPLVFNLSGLELEYRIIQLYSRSPGRLEGRLTMEYVVSGAVPPRNPPPRRTDAAPPRITEVVIRAKPLTIEFQSAESRDITFRVTDENGKPTVASFVIRDSLNRVYPSQAKRLAPDFAFHPQVYRGDGEVIRLPDGEYTVTCRRGPESVPVTIQLSVDGKPADLKYQVQRWIDPMTLGWVSGDHHIHAAGCAHYSSPTEGVHAEDMIRHCMGEDLKVGCNLTWGPCFDYQLQFFTGEDDEVSRFPYLLRYDIEVSGFGSHRTGHLCLLRLTERNFPGGDSNTHWPTLGLNTLKWAKKQGAITGPAHSGSGLAPSTVRVEGPDGPNNLPNFAIPRYNGIGANEFIVDVTHEVPGPDGKPVPAVDFISTMDTNRRHELNMWYHSLNCGFRVRVSGETDFPCISGQRVGMGRVYVKVDGTLNYEDWCEGIRQGRSYVSDGTSHLMEYTVHAGEQAIAVGTGDSELRLDAPATVRLTARVAARLGGRRVPIEAIVNAYPVATQEIVADGSLQEVSFDVPVEQSSWVALRLFPTAHTNPVFVIVDGQPIRASRHSAEWCLRGVDQCWQEKQKFYAAAEMDEARRAYDHARTVYRKILAEH